MKVIVGLGNPGPRYLFTRHNFGFMVVDFLVQQLKGKLEFFHDREVEGEWTRVLVLKREFFLLKPLTYMNLSGICVKAFSEKFEISPSDFLIVYDDIDLPLGKVRLRKKGSGGGHKGMGSIIATLKTEEIPRLRLGIGPKPENVSMVDFVLGEFEESELKIVKEVLYKVKDVIYSIVDEGIDITMSKFNG